MRVHVRLYKHRPQVQAISHAALMRSRSCIRDRFASNRPSRNSTSISANEMSDAVSAARVKLAQLDRAIKPAEIKWRPREIANKSIDHLSLLISPSWSASTGGSKTSLARSWQQQLKERLLQLNGPSRGRFFTGGSGRAEPSLALLRLDMAARKLSCQLLAVVATLSRLEPNRVERVDERDQRLAH